MEAKTVTLSIKVKVNLLPWNTDYTKFLSFSSEEDALFFWSSRQFIVPNWSEEICELSLNPFTSQYYLLGVTMEDESKGLTGEVLALKKAQQEAVFWKTGWQHGRQQFGKEIWDAYYKGVRDEQAGSVYDKEHGQKLYPEIK